MICQEQIIHSICNALYRALADDAFYIQLEEKITASGRDGREGMLHYYDYSIQTAKATGRLVLPHDQGDWGAALWSLPSQATDKQSKPEVITNTEAYSDAVNQNNKTAYFVEHLGQSAYEHYQAVCDSMAKLTKPFITDKDWYLSIIGIAPEYQSQGLGKQLLSPVLSESDKVGVSTYLETFVPRNKRFYERYGFKTITKLFEPELGTHYHILRRPVGG